MNALLAPHRRIIWIALAYCGPAVPAHWQWLTYGLTVPLTAGLLVLLAPGLVPSADRHIDRRDRRAVLLVYVGVMFALYMAFQVFTVERTRGYFSATRPASSWVSPGP